ncbi:MAG: hypothetical protein IT184_16570 [Acidobacteria bacterium]|nr:hypothetical protein [Acidobacteriota bacterium]
MTRTQRYKHEMLVRVRDFGIAHRDRFPGSSTGGELFDQVAAVVQTIDAHLRGRLLGETGGRRISPRTRALVRARMKTIARAGRRVTREERRPNPFRLPARRTLKVDVATARVFVEEARTREEAFGRFGLPQSYFSAFAALVDELEQAIDARLSSKTVRGHAKAGGTVAVRQGLELVRDLDVIVEVATQQDPALADAWKTARHIEGQGTPVSASNPVPMPVAPPIPDDASRGGEAASPPASVAGSVTTAGSGTHAAADTPPDGELRRAS